LAFPGSFAEKQKKFIKTFMGWELYVLTKYRTALSEKPPEGILEKENKRRCHH
jgi:hypothetical protein